ncbi:MAG: RluA family pseudouridine synthase [Syntrophales bacterium]|jgi:23S rRNA pseudouridine1911/1915/1917 synthase|nr:RluA family pseudouridine synthase [Syntrophales bacterium]
MHEFHEHEALLAGEKPGRARFLVLPEEEGVRLDLLLVSREPGVTRTRIAKLIAEGKALVGGRPCRAGQKLKAGSEVVIDFPEAKPYLAALPEDIPLVVVYEDASLIVIDKPAGMVVHPAAGHYGGTLVNALLFHCHDLSGIGGVLRPGIVHRLDKDTSGLIVAAKSDEAHLGLASQFKRHEVKKTYQAVVYGLPHAETGRIEAAVGRHPSDRKKMSTKSKRGRSAITIWRVRERYGAAALLEVDIETGRTHQIRVHLADLGYPVVGDPVYGKPGRSNAVKDAAVRRLLKIFPRQALHAWRLSFCHPAIGAKMEFFSPLPEDMEELCVFLRKQTEKTALSQAAIV